MGDRRKMQDGPLELPVETVCPSLEINPHLPVETPVEIPLLYTSLPLPVLGDLFATLGIGKRVFHLTIAKFHLTPMRSKSYKGTLCIIEANHY